MQFSVLGRRRSSPLRSRVSSKAQPKHCVRFSLTASIMRKTLPISKMVAPMKAEMPPPFEASPGKAEEGRTEGSQTRKELMTQTTEPQVNHCATM